MRGYTPKPSPFTWVLSLFVYAGVAAAPIVADTPVAPRRLKVLFLGDSGPHSPADRAAQVLPVLGDRGIDLFYTEDLPNLNAADLARHDCLLIYANHTTITPEQERALLDYVAGGGGLVAVHCASFCFHNSPAYIGLVGAQFKSHGAGEMTAKTVAPDHPAIRGLQEFTSWDETYVHHKHNEKDRTVLQVREEVGRGEPWTWVREHGKGRVFYTAWGHDERTWGQGSFQALLERGVRWASGDWALAGPLDLGLQAFEYVEADIPTYRPGGKWGDLGEPIRRMQKPLGPAESLNRLVVPPGFHVELFAAEPDIVEPIAMTFDEHGRLWIAETVDYPNEMRPEGLGRDRIKICEDTDGDGRADKFTVFADKLSIPTGLVHAGGGLIVSQAPQMLLLKDNDGDGVCDERRVLFTGFGTRDTHAGPSNLRYGFDNWVWGTVGYSGFDGDVGGRRHRFGQGVFRFRPDGLALEFIGSTSNNTWGLGLSETGEVFASTANNDHSLHVAIPNRYYESVGSWHGGGVAGIAPRQLFHPITLKVRQMDWHGRFTSAAGHALYTARRFPREYWDRIAFVAEPTGHLLHRAIVEPLGSSFVTRDGWNMLASDDEWTAPTMAEVGPDGALWVIDWYNYIVQHNPTPPGFETGKGNAYVTPLRDKTHARVYRVVHGESGVDKPKSLSRVDAPALLAALRSDNLLWRLHAQRLLVERGGADIVPELVALTRETRQDAIGSNAGAVHALWTLHGLSAFKSAEAAGAAITAIKHPAPAVRKNAAAVVPRTSESAPALVAMLRDPDLAVRRVALLALSEVPAMDEAGSAVFDLLTRQENASDRWVAEAAVAAAARHNRPFLRAALSTAKRPDGPPAEPVNLLADPSFESVASRGSTGWATVDWQGKARFGTDVGRSGRCIRIGSKDGADGAWFQRIKVEPNTQYRLAGWIKTEEVDKGSGLGPLLNVHELPQNEPMKTNALTGTNPWTQVEVSFNSGAYRELTINCMFGGLGRSTGTAWYDDLEVVAVGSPGTSLGSTAERAVRVVSAHYAQEAPAGAIADTLLPLRGVDGGLVSALLDGLAAGWPRGKPPRSTGAERGQLVALMGSLAIEQKAQLLILADRWGQRDIFSGEVAGVLGALADRTSDPAQTVARRIEAANRWIKLADETGTIQSLTALITPATPRDLIEGILNALGHSALDDTGRLLLTEAWINLTPASRQVALSVLLRRPSWTRSLLDQVESSAIARAELSAQQWHQLALHADATIAERAKKLRGAAPDANAQKIVARFMSVAKAKGDPANGKLLFAANCMACHEFAGVGGTVGPSLTGIGQRPREELIVAILDPNRSVETNYQLWTVTTADGQTLAGRLDGETQTTIELLDLLGQKHAVDRRNVKSLKASSVSLMPAGFDRLGEQGLGDLLEYLATPFETSSGR